MADTVFEYFEMFPPGPGVALLSPLVPLPSPWFESEAVPRLICDLCEGWVYELWPLQSYPPVELDDDNAGDTFVCRTCAEAIRPPRRRETVEVR